MSANRWVRSHLAMRATNPQVVVHRDKAIAQSALKLIARASSIVARRLSMLRRAWTASAGTCASEGKYRKAHGLEKAAGPEKLPSSGLRTRQFARAMAAPVLTVRRVICFGFRRTQRSTDHHDRTLRGDWSRCTAPGHSLPYTKVAPAMKRPPQYPTASDATFRVAEGPSARSEIASGFSNSRGAKLPACGAFAASTIFFSSARMRSFASLFLL